MWAGSSLDEWSIDPCEYIDAFVYIIRLKVTNQNIMMDPII